MAVVNPTFMSPIFDGTSAPSAFLGTCTLADCTPGFPKDCPAGTLTVWPGLFTSPTSRGAARDGGLNVCPPGPETGVACLVFLSITIGPCAVIIGDCC